MQTLEIFPVELFVFHNENINNKNLVSFIQSLENIPVKQGSVISLLEDFRKHKEFEELFDWFNLCLQSVKEKMQFDCESLKITNSWCNISKAHSGMGLNYHRHSMSFYSGVYYLTEGAPTIFEDPIIHRTQAQIEVARFNYSPSYTLEAQAGKLCIFPSWMYHRGFPHYSDNDRYIISFNCLPNGKINYNIATDSKAEIEIK